ncbi:MAG TPA: GNAT family N-acetyltransferase [Clostridiales bacterium]|nr:GNAT family N-acetyltransferase [Clostridiales bacterium]
MIRFADKEDLKSVMTLWQSCFGDEIIYIENFLNNVFSEKNCLIYQEEEEIVSFLFLLESPFVSGEQIVNGAYIYAACTNKAKRGKGYMGALMNYVAKYGAKKGYEVLYLVPADNSLFGFYEKFGYEKAFKRKEFILNREIMEILADSDSQPGTFDFNAVSKVRNRMIAENSGILWNASLLLYSFDENELSGGKNVFACKNGETVGYAQIYEKGDRCFVKEFCSLNKGTGALIKQILQATDSLCFEFSLAMSFPFSSDNAVIVDNAMAFPLSDRAERIIKNNRNAYLGLTFG